MEDTVKTSLSLTKQEVETLKKLAEEDRTSVADILRAAISTEAFLLDAVQEGGRVLLEDRDETIRELVLA